MPSALDELKSGVRSIASRYRDRFERARRLYVEERARGLQDHRDLEYSIKADIAKTFGISYRDVCLCGSAQLGFSVHKDREFIPATSDLDVACVSAFLFQKAWSDIIETTNAFSDDTKFAGISRTDRDLFKEQILRRGMIRVDLMPTSMLSTLWRQYQDRISRRHSSHFSAISVAIYMNEFAFCWKQDSALAELMGS